MGAWDGYWSFEALRRGAREVLAIDDFSDFLGQLKSSDRKAWDTFDLCRHILGHSSRTCQRVELSVYDLNEATLLCDKVHILKEGTDGSFFSEVISIEEPHPRSEAFIYTNKFSELRKKIRIALEPELYFRLP